MSDNWPALAKRTFDISPILSLAERLRGRPCTCERPPPFFRLDKEWSITMTFDDGEQWQFRKFHVEPGEEEQTARLIEREVATIKFLEAETTIPTTTVHAYSPHESCDLGMAYILESLPRGTCVNTLLLKELASLCRHDTATVYLTDDMRLKIMRQLGEFTRQLASLPFLTIGMGSQDDDGLDTFDNDKDYLDGLCDAMSKRAQDDELGSSYQPRVLLATEPQEGDFHEFDASTKISMLNMAREYQASFLRESGWATHSRNRFAYSMAAELLKEKAVPQLVGDGEGFFLHPNFDYTNIYIDQEDNCHITCITGWTGATSVPLAQLMTIPWHGSEGSPDLVKAFRETAGRGLELTPEFWARTDKMKIFQRLTHLEGYGSDYNDFATLLGEEDTSIITDRVLDMLDEQSRKPHNLALLAKLQAKVSTSTDTPKRRFRRCDETNETDRVAIARKLTVAWSKDLRFVADKRLWRWVYEVTEERNRVDSMDIHLDIIY